MRFLSRDEVRDRFAGKSVAIVGSGPGVLENAKGFVDAHDVVVRVNNYKLSEAAGRRTDVFYSFFGNSIRKTPGELRSDGVNLCICKCPDAHAIQSEWHRRCGKMLGVDFRWIYKRRADFWFCDTYIPSVDEFLSVFRMLGDHVPTTGFSAIVEVLSFEPRSVYLTGFDFFRSRVHNVTDRWRAGDPRDPIGHVPERELKWLASNAASYPVTFDLALQRVLNTVRSAA